MFGEGKATKENMSIFWFIWPLRRKRKAVIVSASVLSKVLSLDRLSCPQILNIEHEKDREKENVGGRPAKLNEEKGDRDLEREIKNKGDIFSLEEQQENFVAAVTKWEMLAATNAKWKWAAVKKGDGNTYDIFSIKLVT